MDILMVPIKRVSCEIHYLTSVISKPLVDIQKLCLFSDCCKLIFRKTAETISFL